VNLPPNDRKFTKTHEWYKIDENIVTVGITKFAADDLTDITHVEFPPLEAAISLGATLVEIESVKTVRELFCAAAGRVSGINTRLINKPQLINTDPFGSGWIIKLQTQPPTSLDSLMDADMYREWIGW